MAGGSDKKAATDTKKHKKSHKKKEKSSSSTSGSLKKEKRGKHSRSNSLTRGEALQPIPPLVVLEDAPIPIISTNVEVVYSSVGTTSHGALPASVGTSALSTPGALTTLVSAQPSIVLPPDNKEEVLLNSLVEDEQERENIKNTLRRFEIIRKRIVDGKIKDKNGTPKRKFRNLYKRGPSMERLAGEDDLAAICVRSASADALLSNVVSATNSLFNTNATGFVKASPYDTGISTTARVMSEVAIPLVDVRLTASLAMDWKDLPNISAIRAHFTKEGRLDIEVATTIVERARALLVEEPNCLTLEAPCVIFGDIHGQFFDLLDMFKKLNAHEEDILHSEDGFPQCLFLGDYVDRGCFSTEVLLYLFSLKLRYPKKVHLLRGNHESRGMTKSFNFKKECLRKYTKGFYRLVCRTFDALPIAATLKTDMGTFFCVHGGISPELEKLSDLQTINRFQEPSDGLFCDLLWADPLPLPHGTEEAYDFTARATSLTFEPNSMRGCSVHFGLAAVTNFLAGNDLAGIIRGHEMQREGFYEHLFGYELLGLKTVPRLGSRPYPPVLTVFSAPNYCDADNKGAAIQMNRDSWRAIQIEANTHAPYCLPTLSDAINFSISYLCDCIAKAYTYMLAQVVYVLCTDEKTETVDCDMYQKMVALLKNSAERKIQRELQRLDATLHHPFLPKSRRPSPQDRSVNKSKPGLFLSSSTNF